MLKTPVKIFEIDRAIDFRGSICSVIQMAGCNLHKKPCDWCNAKHLIKLSSGDLMTVGSILRKVIKIGCQNITITGGEPLYQKGVINDLIITLSEFGYNLTLDTNGTINIDDDLIDYIDCVVADYKMPSSGCEIEMDKDLFKQLRANDFIKMTIYNGEDLDKSVQIYKTLRGITNANFVFSSVDDSDKEMIYNFLVKRHIINVFIQ